MEPKVCVVVVTHNKREDLKHCIESIQSNRYSNKEIIVVDNASIDGSSEMVLSNFPLIKLIRNKENSGYTGGNNIGIKNAIEKENCDYILILNDDTISDANLITELVNIAGKDLNIGVASPKILFFEDGHQLCQLYGRYNFYLGIGHKPLFKVHDPEEIDLLRGTCFIVKREVIEKIGLMDMDFFLYFDEADLSYRVKKAGYKIIYVPSAKVYHQRKLSLSGRINPVVLYYSTRNELLFARKHLNPLIFFPLWIPRFISRTIGYWLKSRSIIVVKAILEGFFDFTRNRYGKTILPNVFVAIKAKPGRIFG